MNGNLSNQDQVVSKYFTYGKVSMDESLTDFQEPKKKFSGPKTAKPKAKAKPRAKKIKGQKDIRSALKKNDIVEYTKDFNTICRKSGIDVDSEQLQLAIAISKSLQEQNSEASSSTSKPLTVKQRTGDIRKTLQEYGFKVPKNVTATGNRRLRKYKKDSKLLLTSDEEKQQIIADKYAQVLFQSLQTASLEAKNEELYGFPGITPSFLKASNIAYEEIKETKVFYVENLIDEYPNSVGSLLRDYSTIPGRPLSPFVGKKHDFEVVDFDLTGTEMDVILSGKLKVAQKIVMEKIVEAKINVKKPVKEAINDSVDELIQDGALTNKNARTENNSSFEGTEGTAKTLLLDQDIDIKTTLGQVIEGNFSKTEGQEISPVFKKGSEITTEPRCVSPDLFDDDLLIETTVIIPDSQIVKEPNSGLREANNSQELNKTNIVDLTIKDMPRKGTPIVIDETLPTTQTSLISDCTKRRSDDFMEITEYVNNISEPKTQNIAMESPKGILCNSKNFENVSRRISEDLMEITDCIHTKPVVIEEDIDLTQGSDHENNDTLILEDFKNSGVVDNMDLTQSTDSNDSLPFVHIGGTKADINYDHSILGTNKSTEVKDVENIHENIEEIKRQSKSSKNSDVFDEFVYEHSHSSHDKTTVDLTDDSVIKAKEIDLTQSSESNDLDIDQQDNNHEFDNQNSHQAFDNQDFHQGSDKEVSCEDITLIDSNEIDLKDKNNENDYENIDVVNIDTEIPLDDYIDIVNDPPMEYDISRDDTILYDDIELINDINTHGGELGKAIEQNKDINTDGEKIRNLSEEKQNSTNENHDNTQEKNKDLSQSVSMSQNSEVFEISDEELNYSVHKSKFCDNSQNLAENFDIGGISVLDNMESYRKSSTNNSYKDFEDDSLPIVNIKGTRVKTKLDLTSTPNDAKETPKTPSKLKEAIENMPKPATNVNEMFTNTPKIDVKTKGKVAETPKNSEFIVKFDQVTPMADYASMSTPERNTELDKFGLKPLKRKRAIQMLTHLYNQTHPLVEETEGSPSKKQKHETFTRKSPRKIIKNPKNMPDSVPATSRENFTNYNIMGTSKLINENDKKRSDTEMRSDDYDVKEMRSDNYNIHDKAIIKDVGDCDPEDWVFQKREKAKVHSCRVPLHIAFHNYVSSSRELRETILRYEPVNIEVIHKDLVAFGHRYDPKDLLKYLDKKCITVKTADNNARNENNKKTKKKS